MYDSRLGRWLAKDPLEAKYTSYSPYHAMYLNPIVVVDRDGKENIVVVGNQGDSPSSDMKKWYRGGGYRYGENKRHFLEAGLNSAIELKKNHTDNNETTTLLIYKGEYSDDEIKHYQDRANQAGINVVLATTESDVKTYINESSGVVHPPLLPPTRGNDLITDFVYIGHGSNNALLFGYGSNNTDYMTGRDFDPMSFGDNCDAWLLGCGNGLDIHDYFVNNLVNGNVFGYNTTVIWGQNGLGSYAPFTQKYYPATQWYNRYNPNRPELKKEERTNYKKGKADSGTKKKNKNKNINYGKVKKNGKKK